MSRARDIADGKFAGDLTVDTNTLKVDSSNNRVAVGTTSTSAGQVTIQGSGNPRQLVITDDGAEKLQIFQIGNDATIEAGSGGSDSTNLIFKTASSGTESEAMRITSSGSVGIGKSTPASALHISNSTYPQLEIDDAASRNYAMGVTASTFRIRDVTGTADRLTITSGGNVGIGLTAPEQLLHLRNASGN